MSDRLNKLIDEQNRLWNRMQDIQRAADEEDRDWTAEERTNWDAAEQRLTTVSEDIERLQRAAKLEAVDDRQVVPSSGPDPIEPSVDDRAQRYEEAFWAYARRGMDRVTPTQRELLMENFTEHRAQGIGTGAAGGFLVPEGFRAVMTETMLAYGGLLNVVNVISTSTGNDLPWPTNDDTANKGAILAENTQIGEENVTLGQRSLGAYTYTSKLVRVSWQLLQDSAFDLGSWLPQKLGTRIGRIVADHLASGTGTGQPEGILTNATVGFTGGASATPVITYDDLIELEHSVDPSYRVNGRYVMSDGALKLIRKVKDTDGRPIWLPVPAPGFPSTINGISYTIDNSFPDPAVSGKSVLFGDLQAGYIVRQVRDVQMVRMGERYADFLQDGFFGFSRLDGRPDDEAAIRVFTHGAAA